MRALLLCLFIGGSGVGYVWQKEQLNELGRQIKDREIHRDALRRQNESYERALAILQSTRELDLRVKQLNLGLVPPQPEQVVRLVDNLEPLAPVTVQPLYAENPKLPQQRTASPYLSRR
ncbi:MAG: hypothetical protein AB1813_04995 [Verrucomicrobiota bacterium]